MPEIKIITLAFSVFAPLSWLISMLVARMYKVVFKRYLIFFMAAVSLSHILTYAKFQNHLDFYITFFPIQSLVVFLMFPLFYLYIHTITSEKTKYNWRYFIHYAMPILLFLSYFFISKIWMNPDEEKQFFLGFLNEDPVEGTKFIFGYYLLSFGRIYYLLSSVFYTILIILCYKNYKAFAINIFPSDYTKELNWVKSIGVLLFIVLTFNLYANRMHNIDLSPQDFLISLSYFTYGIFLWVIGFYGFRQKEVYNKVQIEKTENFKDDVKISKDEIEKYLLKNKAYLNTNLNIYDLCVAFRTNRTYLSTEINRQFGMNFRSLINSYRILDAKELISQAKADRKGSFFGQIATDTGFNSYSSFLRVFKNIVGISPTEFYKKS